MVTNFALNKDYDTFTFFLCNRSLKKSQLALWISWPVLSLLSLSTSFSGLAIYSKYYGCDPLKAGRISAYDQV
jgi:sodium-coupled monocarboxylate transporter 8/12